MKVDYYQVGGINNYINPLSQDGALLHSQNMDSFPYGAKTKRQGYTQTLGTANGSAVRDLFHWVNPANNSMYLYRASGTQLYYSVEGTGAWTAAGNGGVDGTAHVGYASYGNALLVGDGVTNTRHTTNGTAFTDTTLAPKGNKMAEFQGRIYIGGTANTLFYSSANDGTQWSGNSPYDSSSLEISGAGYINSVINAQDRIIITKTQGGMKKWDGYALVDMSTEQGAKSRFSVAQSEDYWFWTNSEGLYGFGGGRPEILSNSVQRYFYNRNNQGVSGSVLKEMIATVHRYEYMAVMGTVTDDLTEQTINGAILKYDFQKNEFLTYKNHHYPTAIYSYKDTQGQPHLIFGDSSGQVYEYSGTAQSDNGQPIESVMLFCFNHRDPARSKQWKELSMFFNPGCRAQVQYGLADTYTHDRIKWSELGDVTDGYIKFKFNARSRLLFVRIYENSQNAPFTYYGCSIDADINTN